MGNYHYSGNAGGLLVFITFMAVLAVTFTASLVGKYSDPHWETVTVTEKNVNPGNGGEVWLVYTEDEVYCITDLWWAGFYNSSDVYNSLKVGNTYRVYVSGKRWPIWSAYKVIRKAEPLECDI